MYAAAGGASLASRQARKRQAAQQIKTKQQAKDKAAQAKALADAPLTPTKSKHFHQLPASYLKAPHAHTRKFSAGYSTQSKLLLPISEQGIHPTAQQAHTNHHYIQHQHNLQLKNQREEREERCLRLKKSATATLPLSQQAQDNLISPPTPTICFNTNSNNENMCRRFTYNNIKVNDQSLSNLSQQHLHQTHFHSHHHHHQQQQLQQPIHLQIPLIPDPIIVTPATPLPSPASGYDQQQLQLKQQQSALQHPTTLQLNTDHNTSKTQLERKCSINRGRKLDPFEENFYKTTTITTAQEFYNDDYLTVYDGLPNGGNKWEQTANNEYCDSEHRHIGVCTCDHTEVIIIHLLLLITNYIINIKLHLI